MANLQHGAAYFALILPDAPDVEIRHNDFFGGGLIHPINGHDLSGPIGHMRDSPAPQNQCVGVENFDVDRLLEQLQRQYPENKPAIQVNPGRYDRRRNERWGRDAKGNGTEQSCG